MPYANPSEQREYQRQWTARRRAEYFKGKTCAVCGATENLQIDHIDPTQKVSHHIWSWTAKRRDKELAKCQVLCGAHHLIKTMDELGFGLYEHGSRSTYETGCRCEICRAGQIDRMKEWRERTGYSYRDKVERRQRKIGG